MRLRGLVAVVTGASRGIGEDIAIRYSKEGATLMLSSRNEALLSNVKRKIEERGGSASYITADVGNPDEIDKVIAETVRLYGKLDIMVNNAGISMVRASEELTAEDWKAAFDINLFGMFYGCRAAAQQMIPNGGGSIINITSIFASSPVPMRAAYCTSKAGGNMLTKVLAAEWADRNIRVNAIAPGYIETELVQNAMNKGLIEVEKIKNRTPQRRMGSVEDVSRLAVYLASEEASFMTGAIVTVDGGWLAYGFV